MKKFLVLLLKLFIWVLPVLIINIIFVNTNYWKTVDELKKYEKVPKNIQVCNLGHSQGQLGINYDYLPEYTTMNFGLGGQQLEYSIRILKEYEKNFADGAVVYLPIAFFETYGYALDSDLVGQKYRYYRILKPTWLGGAFDNWKLTEFIKYYMFPILSQKNIFKKIKENKIIDVHNTASFTDDDERFEENIRVMSKNFVDNYKHDDYLEYNIEKIKTIYDICKKDNFKLVMLYLPLPKEFMDKQEEMDFFIPGEKAFFDAIAENFPDVPVYDYSRDEELSNKEYFIDCTHLNSKGAVVFSKRLFEDTKEYFDF